ncbi:hypothetical protein [Pseudoalteromonas sp. T1lg23B]|uniref:hypothetical protein n=1 Tax=Pseudoalteromonas sp. T1lg23B TaxID=2077097 RepID=UPI000CF6BEBB|nr:hypothetical protein [Pseudoalteromonas sp. T1lg23B]
MKTKICTLALLLLAPITYAETVTYGASFCEISRGHAQKDISRGTIENRTESYDHVYCPIPTREGKDILEVGANIDLWEAKSNHGTGCNVTFYNAGAQSLVIHQQTNKAQRGRNYLAARGFMLSQFNDVGRGVLGCSLPGNNDGVSRFTSFVVSYSD